YLKREFPHSQVSVVYIPAPLSCYTFKNPIATITYFKGRGAVYPAETLYGVSHEIEDAVSRIARQDGAGFISARAALQEACRHAVLHGPNDMGHFNQAGYQTLTDAIIRQLPDASPK